MSKYATKAVAAFVWAVSPEGRKDFGALVAVVTAIYTTLHQIGVV